MKRNRRSGWVTGAVEEGHITVEAGAGEVEVFHAVGRGEADDVERLLAPA